MSWKGAKSGYSAKPSNLQSSPMFYLRAFYLAGLLQRGELTTLSYGTVTQSSSTRTQHLMGDAVLRKGSIALHPSSTDLSNLHVQQERRVPISHQHYYPAFDSDRVYISSPEGLATPKRYKL
jgi:hypothetical protein